MNRGFCYQNMLKPRTNRKPQHLVFGFIPTQLFTDTITN